jgi:hypothetical protein
MNKAVGFVLASLQNSAYRKRGKEPVPASYGREERCGSSPRIARAALDDLFDDPEGVF